MRKRQRNFLTYLHTQYDLSRKDIPTLADYKSSKHYQEVFDIYRQLGGTLPEIPFGINKSHIDFFVNDKIIELDEENHFNRYRLATLQASIYERSTTLIKQDYARYCELFENKCRTYAGYWTSRSSEKQFGKSPAGGDFSGNGPARFKQRAFYDLLKDFIPFISGRAVIRISVYDTLPIDGKEVPLNTVLKEVNPSYIKHFHRFIDQRLQSIY